MILIYYLYKLWLFISLCWNIKLKKNWKYSIKKFYREHVSTLSLNSNVVSISWRLGVWECVSEREIGRRVRNESSNIDCIFCLTVCSSVGTARLYFLVTHMSRMCHSSLSLSYVKRSLQLKLYVNISSNGCIIKYCTVRQVVSTISQTCKTKSKKSSKEGIVLVEKTLYFLRDRALQ